jgi:hypothetical protein
MSLKINLNDTDLSRRRLAEFEPSKFAKKSCRNCGGTGWLRVHTKIDGKVTPKDNNLEHRPCGCALQRYKKHLARQPLRLFRQG